MENLVDELNSIFETTTMKINKPEHWSMEVTQPQEQGEKKK